MESVISDQPVRTAQFGLKLHFTQMSECPFWGVASHDFVLKQTLSKQGKSKNT